jgi:hypothetical protein
MFGQSQPKSNDTIIREVSFRLTLPGAWSSGPTDDPSKRTYHTKNEQLTVTIFGSLFGASGEMKHDNRVGRFHTWVNKRRDLEKKLPGFADVVVSEPSFGESQGTLAARYTGFDEARQRRFHCLVLASSSAFDIFYFEAVDMNESVVEDRGKAIFNSIDIPK